MGTATASNVMTKGDLITYVYQNSGDVTSKAAAKRVVDLVFDGISNGVVEQSGARFPGFGSFIVRKRKARTGRNPKTGETVKIKASKSIGFRAGKGLKEAVNG